MYAEFDEGLGTSPPPQSFQREAPTFMPDEEDYSYAKPAKNRSISYVFPQRLDLSTFNGGLSTPTKKQKTKKKPSPIKPYHDSALDCHEKSAKSLKSLTFDRSGAEKTKSRYETTIDLDEMRKNFDKEAGILNSSLRARSSASSITSDRAPSVTSSTGSLRSMSIQLNRAKQVLSQLEKTEKKTSVGVNYDDVFADSDFHLTTSSDDDTRPPSSQASLAYEVENPRRQTSDLISRVTSDGIRASAGPSSSSLARQHTANVRNAATSTSGFLSDSFLADFYQKRGTHAPSNETLVQSDHDRTIVDEVFEDFRRQAPEDDGETPILRQEDSGSVRIEHVRNAPSLHLISNEKRRMDTRNDPSGIHHSLSMLTVSPQKLQQLQQHAHLARSLPNLERFVIRPSTREIFNTPLDIDAICGKGLRKNQKSFSADRIFGGAEIARNIHGDEENKKTTSSTTSGASRAARPTTSSAAKIREASRSRQNSARHPPYCSVAPTDATSYSIGTVSQNLLGTVKSLHPDWLPMVRRLLDDRTNSDVAVAFRDELRKQQLALELKFTRNQKNGFATSEEYDDHRTKLCVLFRILEKLEELRSRGGSYSRVQQVKLIHTALLSA